MQLDGGNRVGRHMLHSVLVLDSMATMQMIFSPS